MIPSKKFQATINKCMQMIQPILNYDTLNKELEAGTCNLLNLTSQYYNNIRLYINKIKAEFVYFKIAIELQIMMKNSNISWMTPY